MTLTLWMKWDTFCKLSARICPSGNLHHQASSVVRCSICCLSSLYSRLLRRWWGEHELTPSFWYRLPKEIWNRPFSLGRRFIYGWWTWRSDSPLVTKSTAGLSETHGTTWAPLTFDELVNMGVNRIGRAKKVDTEQEWSTETRRQIRIIEKQVLWSSKCTSSRSDCGNTLIKRSRQSSPALRIALLSESPYPMSTTLQFLDQSHKVRFRYHIFTQPDVW
jgi:hypothetical protein